MLPPNIEEKISKARDLKAEAERLIREAEDEFFTTELLDHFWQRYVNMSQNEIIPLIVPTHPHYDDEFAKCHQYCRMHGLYGFGSVPTPSHNPPMPHDDATGKRPVVDFDSLHRQALKVSDEIREREEKAVAAGSVALVADPDPYGDRTRAAESLASDFEQRVKEGHRIGEEISANEMAKQNRATRRESPAAGPTLAEVRDRIAAETADLQVRQALAAKIRDAQKDLI